MFKRTQVCTAVLATLGGALLATSAPSFAQTQTIEVTGSRIKRADVEGALPVTVITRDELEASGANTVAEFVRDLTFSSVGNFRPQSGSSAQSWSGVNLRGLGSNRTLVLVDGRRVAKAPNVGDAADMNSIPMAAVERIEVLTDGASAIYGSDAIGGVMNIILRKDFQGAALSYGETHPDIKGGARKESSAIVGVSNDKGRIVMGASKTSREIIFARDYPWGIAKGASSYSNGFYRGVSDGAGGWAFSPSGSTYLGAAGTCNFPDKGFYKDATGRCRYDFNLVAADEAATGAKSVFARGEAKIASDWTLYMSASSTNTDSFGRYAPVPDYITIDKAGPANLVNYQGPADLFLGHRFAAAGNRDTSTDATLNDVSLGVQGVINKIDVDFGARRTTSKYVETGNGFIVKDLATAAINNGSYNIANPFANSETVLKSISTTTGRDALWTQSDIYASATMDLFKFGASSARLYLGLERSQQTYKDIYDSLSEAGQVLGSSGSSAAGARSVDAYSAELLLPFSKQLEASVAARQEKYSDYGSDFSPKASIRFQPLSNLTLRASAGQGFRAPSLPELNQKPAFSADTVVDYRNCMADGGFTAAECTKGVQQQINGLHISNPALKSEKSKQFALGAVWDVTPALSVKVDYWDTKIDGVINYISAQTIVNRNNGTDKLPIPAGLSIKRDPATGAIVQIVSGSSNEGNVHFSGLDLNLVFTHKYAALGSFRHELTWSETLKAASDGVDFNGVFGSPKHRARLSNKWTYGKFDTTWNINLIAKNGDPAASFAPEYITHDLQVAWTTPFKGTKLIVGAVNAGGKYPALVGSPYDQKPFNYYLYDAYGKQMYFRADVKF